MLKESSKKSLKPKKRFSSEKFPTLKLKTERDIAMDFAQKAYTKFDKLIKAIILFGSAAKKSSEVGSDIDIIIIVDDASVKFDEKLILWYREELGNVMKTNPYNRDLHINTVKLTTWWQDLSKGDPTIINILRYGETLIDFGGFFTPLKILLQEGKIKPTPESIQACLSRVPYHIIRSKQSEIGAIEGCFWAMTDTAQAMLMAINILPPSYENIPKLLKEYFSDKGLLKTSYIKDFQELFNLHKSILHGQIRDIDGSVIDMWQDKSEDFFNQGMKIIKEIV